MSANPRLHVLVFGGASVQLVDLLGQLLCDENTYVGGQWRKTPTLCNNGLQKWDGTLQQWVASMEDADPSNPSNPSNHSVAWNSLSLGWNCLQQAWSSMPLLSIKIQKFCLHRIVWMQDRDHGGFVLPAPCNISVTKQMQPNLWQFLCQSMLLPDDTTGSPVSTQKAMKANLKDVQLVEVPNWWDGCWFCKVVTRVWTVSIAHQKHMTGQYNHASCNGGLHTGDKDLQEGHQGFFSWSQQVVMVVEKCVEDLVKTWRWGPCQQ